MALTLHCYLQIMMVQDCPHSLMNFVIMQYCLNNCDPYVQHMALLTLKIEKLLLTQILCMHALGVSGTMMEAQFGPLLLLVVIVTVITV